MIKITNPKTKLTKEVPLKGLSEKDISKMFTTIVKLDMKFNLGDKMNLRLTSASKIVKNIMEREQVKMNNPISKAVLYNHHTRTGLFTKVAPTPPEITLILVGIGLMIWHIDQYKNKYTKDEYQQNKMLVGRLRKCVTRKYHQEHINTATDEVKAFIAHAREKYNHIYTLDFFIAGCFLVDSSSESLRVLGAERHLVSDVVKWFRNKYDNNKKGHKKVREFDLFALNLSEYLRGEEFTTAQKYEESRSRLKGVLNFF